MANRLPSLADLSLAPKGNYVTYVFASRTEGTTRQGHTPAYRGYSFNIDEAAGLAEGRAASSVIIHIQITED